MKYIFLLTIYKYLYNSLNVMLILKLYKVKNQSDNKVNKLFSFKKINEYFLLH